MVISTRGKGKRQCCDEEMVRGSLRVVILQHQQHESEVAARKRVQEHEHANTVTAQLSGAASLRCQHGVERGYFLCLASSSAVQKHHILNFIPDTALVLLHQRSDTA